MQIIVERYLVVSGKEWTRTSVSQIYFKAMCLINAIKIIHFVKKNQIHFIVVVTILKLCLMHKAHNCHRV